MSISDWMNPDRELMQFIDNQFETTLRVYRSDRTRIEEDLKKEISIAEGGYGRKQIQELVQNSADALRNTRGKVEVLLTDDCLYVANQGQPFVESGVQGILYTHLSDKSDDQIGRFGLGFKSIAGISETPEVLSQSVSFGFGKERTAQILQEELDEEFSPDDVPGLRLAWPVSPASEFDKDELLRDLAKWAVTIVKVPLIDEASRIALSKEIESFDETFCLFAPQINQLTLRDTTTGLARSFNTKKAGNIITLSENNGAEQRWAVISKEHFPSEKALASAGKAARRESVTVSWAAPLSGKVERGLVTAYFPTLSQTSLSGRINAPWKLSDDRMNLIESEFNSEILTEVVPLLVGEGLKYQVTNGPDDKVNFGRVLDILPARGRETMSWADAVLNEPVYRHLRSIRSLPDADGNWRSPNQLKMIPEAARRFSEDWLSGANQKSDWIHPDCVSNAERYSKALRLQNRDKETQEKLETRNNFVTEWLEDVLEGDDENPARSITAIKLAEQIAHLPSKDGVNLEQATRARVVLLQDFTLVAPRPGNCFIRTGDDDQTNALIHDEVTDDADALRALTRLNIGSYDNNGDLYRFLRSLRQTLDIDWENGWSLMRGAPFNDLQAAVVDTLGGKADRVIKVRNLSGEWVAPQGLYRTGVVFEPVKEDGGFLVDGDYHAADSRILEEILHIPNRPTRDFDIWKEKWAREYLDEMYSQFAKPELGVPPAFKKDIEYRSNHMRMGPLGLFPQLGQTNTINLTKYLLLQASPTAAVWYRGNNTGHSVISPELWLLQKEGLVETSLGVVPLNQAFFPDESSGHWEDSQDVSAVIPVALDTDLTQETVDILGVRRSIRDLPVEAFRELPLLHRHRDNERAIAETYAWWCIRFPEERPDTMTVKIHDEWVEKTPEEIAVTSDPLVEAEMESLGFPSITVPTPVDTSNLVEYWDLQPAHEIPKEIRSSKIAEPVSLVFLFPALQHEDIDRIEEIQLQVCDSITIESSMRGMPSVVKEVSATRKGDIIYTTSTTSETQLRDVLELLEIDSSAEFIESILTSSEETRNQQLRAELRALDSDTERLLLLVGEERLVNLIPEAAIDYLNTFSGSIPAGIDLAETCLAMFGASTLEKACRVDRGNDLPIPAPTRWNGSYQARKWVKDLGFGEEWAGTPPVHKTTPTEFVAGPTKLQELHDYQKLVSSRILEVLSPNGNDQGLVNLPTGAGKTRVTVQSVIQAITDGSLDYLSDGAFEGPILWLVDSEELCEQAIEAWKFLWRAAGRVNTPLVISRHFASHSAEEETSGVQVVVGTWQKTLKSVDDEDFVWMSEAPIVIIDEAHTAITASYRKILLWTGHIGGRDGRHRALLGLTATPFRGSSDSRETDRLHKRFGNNFLADGVFGNEQPLQWLQDRNVLSRVTMEVIESGQPALKLTEAELVEFNKKHWLPKEREQELGRQSDRTRQIIDSVRSKPKDWPILIFATSVDNAKALATLLTLDGIPAAAIDSTTPDAERKLALQRFKSGELRVLTNYAVLSQGFDAPETRAVYITRPVQSPVRYQQMIGRGLRGPRNGGTEEVLIVNLLDNIQNFQSPSITYGDFTYLASEVQGSETLTWRNS